MVTTCKYVRPIRHYRLTDHCLFLWHPLYFESSGFCRHFCMYEISVYEISMVDIFKTCDDICVRTISFHVTGLFVLRIYSFLRLFVLWIICALDYSYHGWYSYYDYSFNYSYHRPYVPFDIHTLDHSHDSCAGNRVWWMANTRIVQRMNGSSTNIVYNIFKWYNKHINNYFN